MAIDGSTLEMPGEAANAQHFGYPGASRGSPAFPQLRFVAMAECGTHTLCHANPGPHAMSEQRLAEAVIDRADATLRVTADRNFHSTLFWQRALATGARLLFRVKRDLRLPREQELADGSYLSTLYACEKDRRRKTNGTLVRVIKYTLEGIADPEPSYRLITHWFDTDAAPAVELAALYHRRWSIGQSLVQGLTNAFTMQRVRGVVPGFCAPVRFCARYPRPWPSRRSAWDWGCARPGR